MTATFVSLWVAGVALLALGPWWLATIAFVLATAAGCRWWCQRKAREAVSLSKPIRLDN